MVKKVGSPLDPVEHSTESLAAIEKWKAARDAVIAYNAAVDSYNLAIASLKSASVTKHAGALRQEISILEAQKARHEDTAKAVTKAYDVAKKKLAERQRNRQDGSRRIHEKTSQIHDA